MKWYWAVPLVAIGMLGCGDDAEEETDTSPVTIAWIPKNSKNAVYVAGKRGAEVRAEELTASSGRKVTALYLATESGADQITMIDEAVAQKVNGMNIACNDPVACAEAIDASGIPTMTWDADSAESKRYTYLSMDNKLGGMKAAQLMGKLLSGQGKVAVLTGVSYKDGVAQQPSANTLERYNGFRDELATNYANITVEAQTFCDKTDGAACGAKVDEQMTANPDITGWFFISNYPLTASPEEGSTFTTVMPVWEQATKDGKLKNIAFDSIVREVELLQAGLLHVLIGQKYWDWGYRSIDMAYSHIVNGTQFADFTDTGYDIVCENNAAQMLQMWTDNDFSSELTPCNIQ